jgi:O-antigen ligase
MSDTTTPVKTTDSRLPARTGTIVWGGILLLIAAVSAAATFVDTSIYTPTFILWTIVGFGGLLVVAGVVGAIARVTTARTPSASTSTNSRFDESAPTDSNSAGLFD